MDPEYLQMILEMLAGDELAPEDPKTLRATGFLARNWYKKACGAQHCRVGRRLS